MASRGVLVFGVGILLMMSLLCMKSSEASSDYDKAVAGCVGKHSDAGEECADEDDALGLYSDVDDTFKAMKNMATKAAQHVHDGFFGDNNDDSPDIAHNNVDVLGH